MSERSTLSFSPAASAFLHRVSNILGGTTGEMDDGQIVDQLALTQYATDLLINEAERRGLLGEVDGAPTIPFELPDGIEPVETILTRGQEADPSEVDQ